MNRYLGCLLFFLIIVPACKPRNSNSNTLAVGQAGNNGEIVVYFKDSLKVFRKNCPTQSSVTAYSNCPGSEKTWDDVKTGLANQNYDDGRINKVKALLSNWTLVGAESPDVGQFLQFKDLEKIFGITSSGGSPGFFGGAPGQVSVPPPATADSPLATGEVLAAMKEIKNQFNMDLNSYVLPCLANDTPHWSDIVIHYYCLLGQPRACFTPAARANSKDLAGYEKAYSSCENNADFKWVTANQPDVFRYIMYSVYTPAKTKTFRQQDQDQVINEFYGITDPENPSDCKKRPLRKNESRPAGQHCGKRPVAIASPGQGAQQPSPGPQTSSGSDDADAYNDCVDFLVRKSYSLNDVKSYCLNSTVTTFALMQYFIKKNYSPRDAKTYSDGFNTDEGVCIRNLVDKGYPPRDAGSYCKGLNSVGVSCLDDFVTKRYSPRDAGGYCRDLDSVGFSCLTHLMGKGYSPRDSRTYCLGVSSPEAQCMKDLMTKNYSARDASTYCKGVTDATAGCLFKLISKGYSGRDAGTYCKDLTPLEVSCLENLVDQGKAARSARDTCKR